MSHTSPEDAAWAAMDAAEAGGFGSPLEPTHVPLALIAQQTERRGLGLLETVTEPTGVRIRVLFAGVDREAPHAPVDAFAFVHTDWKPWALLHGATSYAVRSEVAERFRLWLHDELAQALGVTGAAQLARESQGGFEARARAHFVHVKPLPPGSPR
jgi:hypothetical protein